MMPLAVRALRHAAVCVAGVAVLYPAIAAAADDSAGLDVYTQNCLFCHGVDRRGIDGGGVDLISSSFVRSGSVDDLVGFLRAGRTPDDSASRTGRPMPAFDWLTDSELRAVADYIRSAR